MPSSSGYQAFLGLSGLGSRREAVMSSFGLFLCLIKLPQERIYYETVYE